MGMQTLIFLLSALFAFCSTSSASTGVHLGSGVTSGLPSIYGISTGWYSPVEGALVANPAQIERTAELLGGSGAALVWQAKYASVAQTMHGLGFPMSGVNEKGLVIQATILLNEQFPKPPKGGHGLNPLQWIQYHLDTSALLAEVIAKSVTLDQPVLAVGGAGYDVQYQVCDTHDCANVAFYGGGAVAYGTTGRFEVNFVTGTSSSDPARKWLYSAITNYTPDASVDAFAQCKSSPCTSSDNAMSRLFKAAEMAKSFVGANGSAQDLSTRLLGDLQAVDQNVPLTTWNETYTYSPGLTTFAFKSPKRPLSARQWMEFKDFAFDCRAPVKLWWLNMSAEGGERTAESKAWDTADQIKLARQHAQEYTPAALQLLIDYPTTKTRCLKTEDPGLRN